MKTEGFDGGHKCSPNSFIVIVIDYYWSLKLFWVDFNTDKILSITLDGNDIHTIAGLPSNTHGLTWKILLTLTSKVVFFRIICKFLATDRLTGGDKSCNSLHRLSSMWGHVLYVPNSSVATERTVVSTFRCIYPART